MFHGPCRYLGFPARQLMQTDPGVSPARVSHVRYRMDQTVSEPSWYTSCTGSPLFCPVDAETVQTPYATYT